MNQNLFKPNHLRLLCQECNLSPSKKYGQNYLISDAPIKKMIEIADLKKDDTVIEIGPGFGVLTFALVGKVKKVIAFEIEKKLEDYWKNKKNNKEIDGGRLEIVWGNALNQLSAISYQLTKYKVVANLPYQITSNILRTLLELENKPESITVMVQKEVAERIVAKPRSTSSGQAGDMSMLAVSVQYYGEPKIITKVARGNFWPSPKVDSAVLYIRIKEQEIRNKEKGIRSNKKGIRKKEKGERNSHSLSDVFSESKKDFDRKFFQVVKAGFANKRKQLWRNLSIGLKLDGDKIKSVLKEVVNNEKIRAEELLVEEWVEIVRELGLRT